MKLLSRIVIIVALLAIVTASYFQWDAARSSNIALLKRDLPHRLDVAGFMNVKFEGQSPSPSGGWVEFSAREFRTLDKYITRWEVGPDGKYKSTRFDLVSRPRKEVVDAHRRAVYAGAMEELRKMVQRQEYEKVSKILSPEEITAAALKNAATVLPEKLRSVN